MKIKRKVSNILVTGGSGFIGSAFIRYLLKNVPHFKGLCLNFDLLTYAGNPQNLKEVENDPRYLFHQGDIKNEVFIEHLCREYAIDTIIHFAAESHVDRSIHGPKEFIETNVLGTFHLLEVIRRLPHIHFHHVSTDEVYGCLGNEGFFTESTPYAPNSPYSASKASSDHLVRAYGKTYHLSTCISNCSNNYGPYHFPEKLIPLTIINCLRKKLIPVYGQGTNVRDWLYVEDHAKALWMLLEKGNSGETYNIGGEEEWRNIDLIHEIIKIFAEIKQVNQEPYIKLIEYVQDRPGHDFRYAIDCSKIKKEIGWHPDHNFSQGIKETILWYINHPLWIENVQSGAYLKWIDTNYANRSACK
ncbi:dTDP-glucose 4,6-dehydratase [Neochlamydia sp. S13]|uniref:dTDP-glucose 4,6-dehydratase n=1 Tax=Neochlamydia sp. S13 TaxID=1353976 RepID=UPI0005A9EDA7|nr:dTDP-glucose 4,6-dehydratase [Neochlamydia sp. S13]BBI17788.1 dTDP-glucose 4,6-dehydratase, rfbB [Neochlamydia sp. S13]